MKERWQGEWEIKEFRFRKSQFSGTFPKLQIFEINPTEEKFS